MITDAVLDWLVPTLLAGFYLGLLVLVWFALRTWMRPKVGTKAPRCKMWVPLSYIDPSTDSAYHTAEDTTPHARCCLPANHRPRSVHLVDPKEIRDLRLARVPF